MSVAGRDTNVLAMLPTRMSGRYRAGAFSWGQENDMEK